MRASLVGITLHSSYPAAHHTAATEETQTEATQNAPHRAPIYPVYRHRASFRNVATDTRLRLGKHSPLTTHHSPLRLSTCDVDPGKQLCIRAYNNRSLFHSFATRPPNTAHQHPSCRHLPRRLPGLCSRSTSVGIAHYRSYSLLSPANGPHAHGSHSVPLRAQAKAVAIGTIVLGPFATLHLAPSDIRGHPFRAAALRPSFDLCSSLILPVVGALGSGLCRVFAGRQAKGNGPGIQGLKAYN